MELKKTRIPGTDPITGEPVYHDVPTLYVGLDGLIYGGWMMDVCNALTLNDCEEIGDQQTIDLVNKTISDRFTVWEDLDEEDVFDIAEFLRECDIDDSAIESLLTENGYKMPETND